MGLDIYLYTAEDARKNQAHDEAWERLWDEHGGLRYTDEAAFRVKEKEFMAGFESGLHRDVPSETNPEHYMNRRYLRSSYNNSGFDRVIPNLAGNPRFTLEGIFADTAWVNDEDPEADYPGGYLNKDDLPHLKETVLPRAQEVAEKVENSDGLKISFVGPNMFVDPKELPASDQEIMKIARENLDGKSLGGFREYSNRDGEFFLDGFNILAAIPGTGMFGMPGVYLVYKMSDLQWYIDATKIVVEFVEELIALIEQDGEAYVSWSG